MSAGGLHGWVRLPDGAVAARFVGVQDDAVKRAKAAGLHHVKLHDNPHPPGPEEVQALLASGQELVWRSFADARGWQPAATLPRLV